MTGNSHDQAALDSVVKNLPACIFLIQGSNSWLLHWQMDFFFFFLPLSHQGSSIIEYTYCFIS